MKNNDTENVLKMWTNSFYLNFNEKVFCPKSNDTKLRKEIFGLV